jgi:hypothetical protein
MKETSTFKYLTDCGPNDYMQAVLQPLLDNEDFVEYFLSKKYKRPNGKDGQPLCEQMTILFR